jgi:RNA polymerase subunit RPABC4/transcription elongation factor Spt4
MSLIKCTECGSMISDKASACPGCGAPNASIPARRCGVCQNTVNPGDKFCPNCGNNLEPEYEETEAPAKTRKLSFYIVATCLILIIVIISAVAIKKIDRPVDAATASRDSSISASAEAEVLKVRTAQEKKNAQLYTEKANPKKFLKNEYSSKNNLLGETVLEGMLTSSASQASYNTIKLSVTFLSKKGEELGKEQILLTDTIIPGGSLAYRQKLSHPRGSREVDVELLSAKGK